MKRKAIAKVAPSKRITVRALRTFQGNELEVFAFFLRGEDVTRIADISRVESADQDALKGFQRPEIRGHVRSIVEYLNKRNVLFPNAIIVAMSPQAKFILSRGPKPQGLIDIAQQGSLTIPLFEEGSRIAWIVDGQQRSLALAQADVKGLPVPIVAFISDDLSVQREQFILVNKARPLPTRLINELLPVTSSVLLPRSLLAKKIPSELMKLLNRDRNSPFFQLIRLMSDKANKKAVVSDTAVVNMIKDSINNPLGALAPYKGSGPDSADIKSMYSILLTYWNAVKAVFPHAWGADVKHTLLMRGAGIEAMGVLMDRIWAKYSGATDIEHIVRSELERIADHCHWTSGTWTHVGLAWNEVENTPRSIKRLKDALMRSYMEPASK